jgi:hypothetical protein
MFPNHERIAGISEPGAVLGVLVSALRRWEVSGKLIAELAAQSHQAAQNRSDAEAASLSLKTLAAFRRAIGIYVL